MENLAIGVSGKIGSYYVDNTKIKKNIFISRKANKKKKILSYKSHYDILKLIKQKKISSAIIFTAISNPIDCKKNKKLSNDINITFTKYLIDYFIKKKIYFIFFSSEYVYTKKNKICKENSKISTPMLYGKQKFIIESYIKKKKL